MSAHKGKIAVQKAPEPVDPQAPARVVAIPKATESAASKTERIGDILRRARLEQNDNIYHIAEYLCIKPAFLVALENSRYDEFPADAYVIGFLRTYATFLGVDGKAAVDRYRYEMAGRRKKPVLAMPIPMSEGPAPTGIIMVGATVAVLLIYGVWYGISSSSRTEISSLPPLPASTQSSSSSSLTPGDRQAAAGLTAPVNDKNSPAVSSPSQPTMSASSQAPLAVPPAAPGIIVNADQSPPATAKLDLTKSDPNDLTQKNDAALKEGKDTSKDALKDASKNLPKDGQESHQVFGDPDAASRIIIRATQSSWVMVTDDTGKAIFDHVLKTGETYKVPNRKGLLLTTGNGNGITLALDGVELPKVATGAPHVVRNIALDPDHLTADPSSAN